MVWNSSAGRSVLLVKEENGQTGFAWVSSRLVQDMVTYITTLYKSSEQKQKKKKLKNAQYIEPMRQMGYNRRPLQLLSTKNRNLMRGNAIDFLFS